MSIGSSVKKQKGAPTLRVGFGAGKQSKSRREKATARAGSSRPGVGISAQNIHWVILGTGKYSDKTRAHRQRKKTGASTGSTKPMMKGMVAAAIKSMGPEALRVAAKKLNVAIAKKLSKRR